VPISMTCKDALWEVYMLVQIHRTSESHYNKQIRASNLNMITVHHFNKFNIILYFDTYDRDLCNTAKVQHYITYVQWEFSLMYQLINVMFQ